MKSFKTNRALRYERPVVGTTRWSKWNAIVKLADMIGVRQEEIMAVGDSNNDYEMLLNAGYSVAMGNACDRVKEISSAVTDTNENDGVAKAIENILNQK